jgi:NAD(P)-dependent dehydrogenase (short-subunit alcohol dehydrogenase family)
MTPEFGSPRTAIVTGGARRIGATMVRALAADGWHVLLHCHDSVEEAEALAGTLANARVVSADLADPAAADRIMAAAAGMPAPAVLINNASRFSYDDIDDFTVDGWTQHLDANLRGPALLSRAFVGAVPAGAGGLIVNMLDAKLAQPNPDFFSYTISKLGLAGLTEVAARAYAARGIRVCGIAPAVTLVSGKQTEANFADVHAFNALHRGVAVDDIVAALRMIIATPVLTGQVITLDAGQRFLGLSRDVQYLEKE